MTDANRHRLNKNAPTPDAHQEKLSIFSKFTYEAEDAYASFIDDESKHNEIIYDINSPPHPTENGAEGLMATEEQNIAEESSLERDIALLVQRAGYAAVAAEILRHNPAYTDNNQIPFPSLPDTAPKLYADRPKGQSIIDFLRDPDGWGPYLEAKALSRPDLRRLDPQAYMALANWLRKTEHKLPPDLQIPTRSEHAAGKEIADQEDIRTARRIMRRLDRQRALRRRLSTAENV